MKKFYLLLSAAAVVASASAVEKQAIAKSAQPVKAELQKMMASPVKDLKQMPESKIAKIKRAPGESDYSFFMPASNLGSIGMDPSGSGYNGLGFASSYGDIVFNNMSTNVKENTWTFSQFNAITPEGQFITETTNTDSFALESQVGQVMAPQLSVLFNSGKTGSYKMNTQMYLCGGSVQYWMGSDSECGFTFYQNCGMKNPEGYNGTSSLKGAYDVTDKRQYNENGVYVSKDNSSNWQAVMEKDYFPGQTVTNLKMDNYMIIHPAPASTYLFTRGWGWINVKASKETQLISYVYPIDEDGTISDVAIAVGYAAVPRGETSDVLFEYNPLNEEGDELEGEVFVDTAVAITIEGFAGNSAIQELCPISGFYPFSYAAYTANDYANADICKNPSLRMTFSMDVDGEQQSVITFDRGLYFYNQKEVNGQPVDDDTLTMISYAQFMVDAVFAFIDEVNGVSSVNVAKDGGEVEVELNAYYYDIAKLVEAGYYEVNAPEWLTVSFSAPDAETSNTTMTVKAAASDTDRTGVVTIEGLGATYSLEVVQGLGGAVEVVTADGEAQYFDLTGRKVANPEKGVYVKVNGNKAEKVIL